MPTFKNNETGTNDQLKPKYAHSINSNQMRLGSKLQAGDRSGMQTRRAPARPARPQWSIDGIRSLDRRVGWPCDAAAARTRAPDARIGQAGCARLCVAAAWQWHASTMIARRTRTTHLAAGIDARDVMAFPPEFLTHRASTMCGLPNLTQWQYMASMLN
jgi:hypothetical protein